MTKETVKSIPITAEDCEKIILALNTLPKSKTLPELIYHGGNGIGYTLELKVSDIEINGVKGTIITEIVGVDQW